MHRNIIIIGGKRTVDIETVDPSPASLPSKA
jgi:hypothetical protein